MAQTPSNMMPLGTLAQEFSLVDTVTEKTMDLQTLKGAVGTVIMFICNHCPFVKHVNNEISNLGKIYQERGIAFIAISSNDVQNYPQDAPHLMKQVAGEEGYTFPYLYDETQAVAKAYEAACTPDFYLFDGHLKLVYRGQLDDSRPGNGIPVTGHDLRAAMNALLANEAINTEQKPSIGCNIKWVVWSILFEMKLNSKEALDKLMVHDAQFLTLFEHGTLQVEIYKPEKVDLQQPHSRDEVYVIISGTGDFLNDGQRTRFGPGDFLFVPAGVEHRFENFTDDFSTWVIFYGPEGGEMP